MIPSILKRYLIALDQYKWAGFAIFALAVGGSGVVALQPAPPPRYYATGILTGNRPTVSFSTTGSQITEQGQVALTPEILLAPNVVEPVAEKVSTTPKNLVRGLKVKVQLPTTSKTGGTKPFEVQLEYSAEEPRRAAAVVNLLMQGMVEQSRLVNTTRLRATIDALMERLPQVTQELRQAERNLEQYDRVEGPALVAAQNGSLLQGITASEQQQRQLLLTLQGLETQMAGLQQRLGLTPNQAYAASALSADPIIANLRTEIYQIESQIEILSKDLRPEHPTLIDLRKRQAAYNGLLQQRANELIAGNNFAAPLTGGEQIRRDSSLDPARQQLANTLVALQAQRETLQQQLTTLKRSEEELRLAYARIPNKQLERSRLEQQVLLKRALYDKLQVALVDARAAEAETVSSLSLTKPAEVEADVPPPTNILLTVGIGAFMGLAAGGGIIFLLGALDGKLYTPEEIKSLFQNREVQLLGLLPLLPFNELETAGNIPVLLDPNSPYADSYERLRSSLRRIEGQNLKVLLFASVLPQEGKTLCAYNLAIASAWAGKRTLLIEANLRSASKAQSLGIAPDPDSQLEPLRYYGQLSECVRLVPQVENLYIVPSPGPQQQSAAILESSEMRRLLEDARGRFDFVIVDSTALSLANDALLIEPLTDGMILITRPGYTENGLLTQALEQFGESEEYQMLGAIINGVEIGVAKAPVQESTSVDTEVVEEVEEAETAEEFQDEPREVAASGKNL